MKILLPWMALVNKTIAEDDDMISSFVAFSLRTLEVPARLCLCQRKSTERLSSKAIHSEIIWISFEARKCWEGKLDLKNAPGVIKIRSLFPFTKLCELAVTSVKMMNSERFLVAPLMTLKSAKWLPQVSTLNTVIKRWIITGPPIIIEKVKLAKWEGKQHHLILPKRFQNFMGC